MEVFTAKETTKLAHLRVSAYLSFTCYAHGYETSYVNEYRYYGR